MASPRSPVTIPIVAVQGLLSGPRQGLDAAGRAALLRGAGIEPLLLDTPAARVTGEQYVALMDALLARLDDEGLGFLSRPLRPGCLALVARSAMAARDGRHALARIAQGIDRLQDDVVLRAEAREGRWGLTIRPRSADAPPAPNFLHEYLLRVGWRLLVWLMGGRPRPRGFDFMHPAPPYAALVAPIFPGELRYGQPASAVWFEPAALEAPLRRDEAALQVFLRQALSHLMLPHAQAGGSAGRLRRWLQQQAPAWPGLDDAARALALGPSTLQRHLAAEGGSFQSVKDGLRRDLAIARLQQGVPLAALATELGFAEPATFQRAFKAWTGSGPGRYRPGRAARHIP